jgi:ribonucleoside-diphosphate reductase alpha chain
MPENATPEEVTEVFMKGWKLGLKAIAVYRENSKKAQPLTTGDKEGSRSKDNNIKSEVLKPVRRKLPDERQAITHKFSIAGHEGYLTVGLYEDGTLGELFIMMAKEGSIISGLMDSFATAISIGLQYGVPLRTLVNHFVHTRFEPSGFTNNPNIRIAKSLVDYIFRWLALKFLPPEDLMNVGLNDLTNVLNNHQSPLEKLANFNVLAQTSEQEKKVEVEEKAFQQTSMVLDSKDDSMVTFDMQADAPICGVCGSMMVRNGACYKCLNCGGTSGCS